MYPMMNVKAAMIMGVGIGPIEPVPMKRNSSGKPVIGLPPVNTSASPLAIVIIPSVVTKGGTDALVMVAPLIRPQAAPTAKEAVMTDDSARIEPTDKSIPAVRMTNVMPTAMMPLMVDWRRTLTILLTVKKRSERMVKTRQSRKKDKINPYR